MRIQVSLPSTENRLVENLVPALSMSWHGLLSSLQIFMLDTEEQSRSEADGQAWKEDTQWASILDQDWDLQDVRQVSCLPSTPASCSYWMTACLRLPEAVLLYCARP